MTDIIEKHEALQNEWIEYSNYLISHELDSKALMMRTKLLAESGEIQCDIHTLVTLIEQQSSVIEGAEEALEDAVNVIEGLYDQQAMPDDSQQPKVVKIAAALARILQIRGEAK